MSKVSFQKPGGPASMVAEAEVVTEVPANAIPANNLAVATLPPVSVPAPRTLSDDDNMATHDLVLPRLNVVQKVGDLSNIFTPGTLVLDGEHILAEAPKKDEDGAPVRIVIAGFYPTKYFEAVEGGQGGAVCSTLAEVAAINGTLDFNEAKALGKKWFKSSGTAVVLIEQPEGNKNDDLFPVALDGKNYALAFFTMKGFSYTKCAKVLKTARKMGLLSKGYTTRFVTIRSKLESAGANKVFVPKPSVSEPTSDALREGLKNLGL